MSTATGSAALIHCQLLRFWRFCELRLKMLEKHSANEA